MLARLVPALLCLGLVATAQAEVKLTPPAERPAVADFTLNTLTGTPVRLADLKGKVVMINFWATWCQPCLQELKFVDEYYQAMKAQGVEVLAVTTDGPQTLGKVRQTVKRRKWSMPVLLDQDGAVMANLNPRGNQPFTLYIDREGRKAGEHDGYTAGDEVGMKATLEALAAEGAATPAPASAPASAPTSAAPASAAP
ncbi:MAG: TlpA family protein disulfide reductase [Myxococcales bacterium]|nr:TlpA family protein disulfide reductase [Myxococcales bacterium]MCB9525573.1 TlpA family protein disulfide reductase [Myxococcales bacterium]